MRDDVHTMDSLDTVLDHMLADWHEWSRRYSMGSGYPSADPMFRDTKTTNVWDDRDGSAQQEADHRRMEAFNFQAYAIEQPWLTALQVQARNLSTGYSVWKSPRLPADAQELSVILMEARNKLLRRLAAAGILS